MTDLEKFIELYRSVGVDYEIEYNKQLKITILSLIPNFKIDSKIDGDKYCYSTITFDKDGKFVMQGFWYD